LQSRVRPGFEGYLTVRKGREWGIRAQEEGRKEDEIRDAAKVRRIQRGVGKGKKSQWG